MTIEQNPTFNECISFMKELLKDANLKRSCAVLGFSMDTGYRILRDELDITADWSEREYLKFGDLSDSIIERAFAGPEDPLSDDFLILLAEARMPKYRDYHQ